MGKDGTQVGEPLRKAEDYGIQTMENMGRHEIYTEQNCTLSNAVCI